MASELVDRPLDKSRRPRPAPLPSLAGMRVFSVAARTLSFEQAALELHVSATAVSHRIRDLELAVGQPLFYRRPLRLSPAGQRLFEVAQKAIEAIDDAWGELASNQLASPVIVTATRTFTSHFLAPRARLIASTVGRPIHFSATEKTLPLERGRAQLAFRYGHATAPGTRAVLIAHDAFSLYAAPKIAELLADSPDHMQALPFVSISWASNQLGLPTYDDVRAAFRGTPDFTGLLATPAAPLMADENDALSIVLAGEAVGLLGQIVTADAVRDRRLVRLRGPQFAGPSLIALWAGYDEKLARACEAAANLVAVDLNEALRRANATIR